MGVASLLFTLTSAHHVAPLPRFVQLILVWVNIHAYNGKRKLLSVKLLIVIYCVGLRLAHTKSAKDLPLTQSKNIFVEENINLRVQM